MGVQEEPALKDVFKSRRGLPMRELGALRWRIILGPILVTSCGSGAVSIRHIQVASQNRYLG